MSRSSLIMILAVALGQCAHAAMLKWSAMAQGRSAPLEAPASGAAGFTRLQGVETGIRFTNTLADAKAAENQIRLVGSGIALGDVDGDGLCDIYACALERGNALYRNLGGWKFEEITGASGTSMAGQYATGAAFADVDGDGDLDLLVNALGQGTRLFMNDGRARFAELKDAGLQTPWGATSLALADVEGDGDLDVYVANYRTNTIRSTGLSVFNVNGKRMVRPEDREQYEFTPEGLLLEHADPDFLFLNDGKGRFAPVSWTSGAFLDEDGAVLKAAHKDWGLSVIFRDMNGDRAPDLYVCNDFWSADRIWINDGAGKFRALPRLAMRNSSTFSMGVDFADIDRDGDDDFFVLDMMSRDHARRMRQRAMAGQNFNRIEKIDDRPQVERNTLYLNRGDGSYAEIAQLAGVQASEWSWGVAFVDVDLDGFEDALITTGHGFDTQDSDTEDRIAAMGPLPSAKISEKLLHFPRLNVPNVAFRNRGDLTFEEVSAKWGFDSAGVSHGIALGDLDNDGDQDVVVNNLNGPLGVYRNNSSAPRIAVRLKGRAPNTKGIGAKIKVTGARVTQSQEVMSGGRYLAGDDPVRTFAAEGNAFRIEVTWRNGTRSVVENVKANTLCEIDEKGAASAAEPALKPREPLFRDVSDLLGHEHREEVFDDFARQPALPRRLSQQGPGVAWFDFDGNGFDDLAVGSGRGDHAYIFQNLRGPFRRLALASSLGKSEGDQGSIVGWPAMGGSSMWVAQSNYETGDTNSPGAQRFDFWAGGGEVKHRLALPGSSAGPMAIADVDGDGDFDVFVGGRVVSGRYPEPAAARLYAREGEEFKVGAEWPKVGLVSGAVFSDLTGDGLPELLLACEWGPVRVFANLKGEFKESTEQLGLAKYRGWWNSVATGDFDGDGRMDIVAGNWGRNTPYEEFAREGLRLHYGDLGEGGSVDIVEAYVAPGRKQVMPWRDLQMMGTLIPAVRERMRTAAAYGEANLETILGPELKRATELQAHWLETTVFLNRGERFEARALPVEAQFAPVFGLCVADSDGDGTEDIFLAQNFFGVNEQTSRYDAGLGLWLRGDGRGGFTAMSAAESGARIHGEQRGAAVCDYDADGRIDFAVAQNAAGLKLFHNERAKPGLRVRLKGGQGNPSAFGAQMRARGGGKSGAIREVQGGSGYLSQNSAAQVLAMPGGPAKIWVRWPGGRETTSDVPDGAREVVIEGDGAVKVTVAEN